MNLPDGLSVIVYGFNFCHIFMILTLTPFLENLIQYKHWILTVTDLKTTT